MIINNSNCYYFYICAIIDSLAGWVRQLTDMFWWKQAKAVKIEIKVLQFIYLFILKLTH